MNLTVADRQALVRASEVMLNPFEHPSPIKYLLAVAGEVLPLVGGFAAMCGTRDPSGAIALGSAQWPEDDRHAFARWKLRDAGTERALQAGMEVITMRRLVGDNWEAFDRDPMVNEWYRPRGVHDVAAYMLHWAEDDAFATVELHGKEFGTPRFGDEGEFLLTLLQPGFRAGMRLLYTVGQLRESIARDLDSLEVPICVCSRDGRIHHISSAVRRLLAGDPSAADVIDRIPDVAAEVFETETGAAGELPGAAAHQVVTTPARRYRLSAARATHMMQFGQTDVLVAVSPLERSSMEPDLASQFGLSGRERQVALLIGRGLSNQDIADVLGVSVHTIKRHTERVFAKCQVHTRSGLAALVSAGR